MSAVRRDEPGYDEDFLAWAQHQAGLLRERRFDELDVDALAGEIEDLGKSERRELRNRLNTLVVHLLKWLAQPECRSRSWGATIRAQRDEIELLLADSPSLRQTVEDVLQAVWPNARDLAAAETDLPLAAFPESPCWTAENVLAEDFLPDAL